MEAVRDGDSIYIFLTLKKPLNHEKVTVLANAEKKLKQLQTDSVEIQTKITMLQEELTTNSKTQETQTAEVENQRKILEGIKSRKKA